MTVGRPIARFAVAVVTFAAVLGIRLTPWPVESALIGDRPGGAIVTRHAGAAPHSGDASAPNDGEAAAWLGVAGVVLISVMTRRR